MDLAASIQAVTEEVVLRAVRHVHAETGEQALWDALERIWRNMAECKTYVTGGVGARHHGEAFGGAYELPNDTAYAETCAGIGLAFWAHRMLILHGDARFADALATAGFEVRLVAGARPARVEAAAVAVARAFAGRPPAQSTDG